MASTPEKSPGRLARFGLFEVDLTTGELRKSGVRLRLQDQPFQMLVMLLEHAGELVTRDQFRQRLWPDDTFVDFDHSLNTAVAKLRERLGDTKENPRFIETLAKRGYRFVAPVQWDTPGVSAAPVPQTATPAGSDVPSIHPRRMAVLFGLLQMMYLVFYLLAMFKWQDIDRLSDALVPNSGTYVLIVIVITACIGIPLRLYLLAAVIFGYGGLGAKFQWLFPGILFLDELWSLCPFLIHHKIGLGAALAATAILLYLPFSQRTLLRMAQLRQA
jgi:DNA-binding winged helix-turn-helix (wHTH) protein